MPVALVSGITGQTGSYLCDELLADGWTVHGIVRDADDLEPGLRSRSPQALLHNGDLEDAPRLRELIRSIEPDAIFNLGGLSSVAQSWAQPELTSRITGQAVATLLDAAHELAGVSGKRVSFVQASSAEIFGHTDQIPQDENTPIAPINPYGEAKAYAHELVGTFRASGFPATSCILYNHESPRRPEQFVTRKITSGVARIAAGLSSSLVLGNLEAERDWGWAPDYAHAMHLAAVGIPDDYVIATGVRHSVRDFVAEAFGVAGISDWERYVTSDSEFVRQEDAPVLVGDASRARRVLGWHPTVDFHEIVARMVEADAMLLRT